jgi:hypothetical protein
MGIIAPPPESKLAKEMAKWEKPWKYVPFPRMLYHAVKRKDGVVVCIDPAIPEAQSCVIVHSEAEQSRAMEAGWRESQKEAMDWFEAKEQSIAKAAAHRNYEDRNMSEKAKAEISEAEAAAGADHLPEVKEKKRGRGRPKLKR